MPAPSAGQGFPCFSTAGFSPVRGTSRSADSDGHFDNKGTTMTATTSIRPEATATTPTERLLTGALLLAPVVYLAADTTYAARGWDDATGGVLHVLGAIAYGFVVLRVASWLPRESKLLAWILLTGLIGLVGNAAYGFEAIHMSLGDTQLVHQPGAANLIKPLGLLFPVSFALIAFALVRVGHRWQGVVALVAMLAWPVAHIGNLPAVAVPVDIALVVAFGSLVWAQAGKAS
jgi:hypothetical protein